MAKPKPLSIAEAKAQAAHWDAMWQQQSHDAALSARFRDATASEIVAMWERGTNEKGQPLNQFEFAALCTCWIETFGTLPPDRDGDADQDAASQPTQPALEPLEPDTLVDIQEVARRTGISVSTIKRMVQDGRFPKPMRPSERRIAWSGRDIDAFVQQLDEQRRSPRQ